MQLKPTRHPAKAQPFSVEPNTAKFIETEGCPSASAPESGRAGLPATGLHTLEEPLKRTVQSFQRPALHVCRQFTHAGQFLSAQCQRLALIDVSAGLASLAIAVDPLLERRVVQFALRVQ